MFSINENFVKLPQSYLFSDIARRVAAFTEANPGKSIIRLGIGDVTRPLAPAVVEAMKKACDEMGEEATFRGYGPEQGYAFLREAIVTHDYAARGIDIQPDEVFVSDGAKSDTGNIGDIFGAENVVAVCDPVYPVYVDTNAMAGRAGNLGADGRWDNLIYMPCTEENGFAPALPEKRADMIYLCFPNNPTGASITYEGLKKWVDYALENGSVILYDSAYEAFITEDIPHSIFEIEGAKKCAIEFRSFSKTAGFTGTRCGYTVVPKDLQCGGVSLNALWNRRQTTKFNGVPYIVQRGAEAVYSEEGQKQMAFLSLDGVDRQMIDEIMAKAKANGMNTVFFHVRPFGDALYRSDYYPWSHLVTGTQGVAPADGFDPLAYAVEAAHREGLALHAWLNPLRIMHPNGQYH